MKGPGPLAPPEALLLPGGGAAPASPAWPENPSAAPSEYQVKAAFLYNFAKFVEWPQEEAGLPLTVCVFGKDPFSGALERVMDGRTVNGRPITIRRSNDLAKAQVWRVLFISASESGRVTEILKAIQSRNVLTVSEADGFCEHGGVIACVMDGQRVRFRINPKAAARANLKISSELLRWAVVTEDDKEKN